MNVAVFSLEYEEIGKGFGHLNQQDFTVTSDKTALFIKITKTLDCSVEHHLKINVLLPNHNFEDWLVLFKPKGMKPFFYF